MALVKCPECGGSVSSAAKQCVHCGCAYTVCPECGGVFVGNLSRCPACGFEFAEQKVFLKTGVKTVNRGSTVGTDVMAVWENRSRTDKIVMTALKWASRALWVLMLILLIIAVIVIETWDMNSLEAILKTKDIVDNVHGLIIAGCAVGALAPIVRDCGYLYSQVVCGMWLRKNGIDISRDVKRASGQVEMTEMPPEWSFDNLSSAAYIAASPNDKNIRIARFVICSIVTTVAAICIGVFLTQNADVLLAMRVASVEFTFKYVALIPSAVFIVAYFLISFICNNIFDKRKAVWLENIGL